MTFVPRRSILGLAVRDEPSGKDPGQPLREKLHRYFYRYTTKRLQDVTLLNYGYEEDPPLNLALAEIDRPNRLGINLYHKTATQVDLGGRDVLEVSCGHGGGSSYLMRAMHPKSLTALDCNRAAIKLCKKEHRIPGLSFVHGDARKLPFPNASFDAVISVEASHGYPGFERFLNEVARVLTYGGHFLYADMRSSDKVPMWEAALARAAMKPVAEKVINNQVVRSLRQNSPGIDEMIDHRIPVELREIYREFAGVEGTRYYQQLLSGEIIYRMYCFEKC